MEAIQHNLPSSKFGSKPLRNIKSKYKIRNKKAPLDDAIFYIDIREERLIIVDYFATLDDKTRLSTLWSLTHVQSYISKL